MRTFAGFVCFFALFFFFLPVNWVMLKLWRPGPEVIKLFFKLNSAETKIYPAHKC